MEITYRHIADLTPYSRNSRIHTPEQIEQLAGLIREFGWTSPILADDQSIVAGHGRLLAAKKIYENKETIRLPDKKEIPINTVPVIDCTGWSDDQRRAYIIADNRISELSKWDNTLLAEEMVLLEIPSLAELFLDSSEMENKRITSADAVREIEENLETDAAAPDDDEYQRIMSNKNQRAKLPIVPQYLESYAAFIIVCTNSIDEAFIRQRLGLGQPVQSYKSDKIRVPNIISVEQLREIIQ